MLIVAAILFSLSSVPPDAVCELHIRSESGVKVEYAAGSFGYLSGPEVVIPLPPDCEHRVRQIDTPSPLAKLYFEPVRVSGYVEGDYVFEVRNSEGDWLAVEALGATAEVRRVD